jgi:hypothetical protein
MQWYRFQTASLSSVLLSLNAPFSPRRQNAVLAAWAKANPFAWIWDEKDYGRRMI